MIFFGAAFIEQFQGEKILRVLEQWMKSFNESIDEKIL